MLPQLLGRDPGARDAKGDSSQEPRVVPDGRSSQDGSNLLLVDASFPVGIFLLQEHNRSVREAKVAMAAPVLHRHAPFVAEMSRQFTTQAAGRGDEVDDAPDALHVCLLPRFDLRVDGRDESILGVLALREVGEDAEPVDDAAGVEFDGAAIVPFL